MIQNEQEYMREKRAWCETNQEIRQVKGRYYQVEACQNKALEKLSSLSNMLKSRLDEYDARVNHGRKGRWMVTFSGCRFWPESPRPEDVRIEDIAHALSLINRFGGHTLESYSVAQHCVLGSQWCRPKHALMFLLHDASEAYLGDIISPVKSLVKDRYHPIEAGVMSAVHARFGVSVSDDDEDEIKRIDLKMLSTEVRDLTNHGVLEMCVEPPFDWKIGPRWNAQDAEENFLSRFAELVGQK